MEEKRNMAIEDGKKGVVDGLAEVADDEEGNRASGWTSPEILNGGWMRIRKDGGVDIY